MMRKTVLILEVVVGGAGGRVAFGMVDGTGVGVEAKVAMDLEGVDGWLIGIDRDWEDVEEGVGGEVGECVGGLIIVMPAEQPTRSETAIAMYKNTVNF